MKRIGVFGVVAVLVAAVLAFSFSMRAQPKPLTLTFLAEADGEPVVFDEFAYTNPGGNERIRLRDFRVYISNIVLFDGDVQHVVNDSYHLLRFDRRTPEFSVVLPDVPLRRISKISMSIGIDEAANGSIETRGDLDPNNRMAWNWSIGYKFVLLEGAIELDSSVAPLVYHVGFNENRRDIVFSASNRIEWAEDEPLKFKVDPLQLFSGAEAINLANLQTVKMDRSDAALLSANYATMIQADWAAAQ